MKINSRLYPLVLLLIPCIIIGQELNSPINDNSNIENPEMQQIRLEYDSVYTLYVGEEYTLEDGKKFLIRSAHSGKTLGCFGTQRYWNIDWSVNGIKSRIKPSSSPPIPVMRETNFGQVRNIRIDVLLWNYEEDQKKAKPVKSVKDSKELATLENLKKYRKDATSVKIRLRKMGPWSGYRN